VRIGDIICAKSIEHREVLELKEAKNGRQIVVANRYGFKFQTEHSLLSKVGVFIFLGVLPEQLDSAVTAKFAADQLRRLGWTLEKPTSAAAVDPSAPDPGTPSTRE